MDGFIIIDKEKNTTSFDVVYKMKKLFNTKKVGHSGTLDPDATGVLVVAVGRATKFLNIITKDSTKEYIASFKLGIKTDTSDITGDIIKSEDVDNISDEMLIKSLNKYICTYDQMPPLYSAKKVNGKRAYDLARKGIDVKLKPSSVTIYDATLIKRYDNENFDVLFKVSKGTYIRSLIEDIASDLNTIATMSDLRRTYSDSFNIDQAVKISNAKVSDLITLKDYTKELYPISYVSGNFKRMVENGVKIDIRDDHTYPCIFSDINTKEPICIYDKKDEGAGLIFKF